MNYSVDDIEWEIRASQIVRTFAPGSLYDNTKDSMIIQGTDYWNFESFGSLSDPYLLSYVRSRSSYLSNLKMFAAVSSPSPESYVPVATFPTWGLCPRCNMLQRRQGRGLRDEFRCRSTACARHSKASGTTVPHTVPVRFVVACELGHIDDFPFYEWAHGRTHKSDRCSRREARLYLEDRHTGSSSLDSKIIVCKNCGCERSLGRALTRGGIRTIAGLSCAGRSPWLRDQWHRNCNFPPRGMLKGATNIYFPVTMSALTIPPFSDELSQEIVKRWHDIEKLSDDLDLLKRVLERFFDVKTSNRPSGKYTLEQVIDKYEVHKAARSETINLAELEYRALNSRLPVDEKEFQTAPVDVPRQFSRLLDGVTLVPRLRQIVTVTGFTRLKPPDVTDREVPIAPISSRSPEWLPATENRGEGIFLSISSKALKDWESKPTVLTRMRDIAGQQDPQTSSGRPADARYVMLHSLSHLVIRSLADMAGYSSAGLQERIYSSDSMAGILIFTASPSSDGSLGGLVEQGRPKRIEQILMRALSKSITCSYDPLCSLNRPDRKTTRHGAACHACLFLPETSCESMNEFLDRSMVCRTIEGSDRGFFPDDGL